MDKARAARLSEFSAAGWSATLAISDLARTPVDEKEAVEASDRFQALSDRFNAALAQIQLLDDGEVYAAAHRVNAYLTALNREARSAHFDHAAVRGRHAELAAHVAAYQRAARKALGSTDLPGPLPWLPASAETYVAGKANDDATSE